MTECDVCTQPCDPTLTITLRSLDKTVDVVDVAACWECATALLMFLTERWRTGIAEGNAAVDDLARRFGLEIPPGWPDGD